MRAGRLVPLGDLATAGLVALVAFLPFARGALTGQAFYFRDFSTSYLPLRLFALTGLREGEFRYWNPYAHEGVPMPYPPVSYPLELFGLLAPGERGFSLLLALHVPLAGIAFLVLARGFGLSRLASAAGAIVYALGGFCLSSLNLYFYLEAMAWAPLVLLSLVRAAEGRRWAMAAALTTAVMVATLGAEVVLQTAVIAVVVAAGRGGGRRLLRLAASAVLGAGLAAPTVCVMRAVVAASARGAGFHPSVVLAHSVHPFTLLQVVVGGLYGDLSNLPNRWWGQNFFPRGFPYVLSLYLGATVLSLAWIGARRGGTLATRLALLSVVAVVVCLGRWAGLQALVEALPVRAFRYPTKAFFTVHIAVALLAARGLDALYRSHDRVVAWRQLAIAALGLGTALVLGPRAFAATALAQPFQSAFFPPAMPWPQRLENFRFIVDDATRGGLIALAAGTVALVYLAQRIGDRVACPMLVALVAADLLRAGAGLNPMVTSSFFRLSEEMRREAELFHSRGRIFTCDVNRSPAYWRARAERAADHDVWSFAVLIETLTPNLNTGQRVRTAFSEDLTSLVPIDAVPTSDASCFEFGAVADRLRAGAVTDVISLDPLTDPRLRLRAVAAPARIAPLTVGIYELADPLPLRSMADLVRPASDAPPAPEVAAVAGGPAAREAAAAVRRIIEVKESSDRIDFTVETDRPAAVVMRETWAEGWTASVNGLAAAVSRADGRYRAVEVPAGRSRVVLRYRPPGLRAGLALAALSIAILVAIPLWARRGMKG